MIRGINHVGLSVSSLAQAAKFYENLMGFEKVESFGWEKGTPERHLFDSILAVRGTAADVAVFRAGNLFLEIFEFKSPAAAPQDPDRPVVDHGYTHIAIDVKDIDGEYERLKAAGMRFHCPPTNAGEGYRVTYGRDPFGNVIELQEVAAESAMSQEQLMKR